MLLHCSTKRTTLIKLLQYIQNRLARIPYRLRQQPFGFTGLGRVLAAGIDIIEGSKIPAPLQVQRHGIVVNLFSNSDHPVIRPEQA